jgi:23S rRNA (cytosine1962-C5)-methyltransferase
VLVEGDAPGVVPVEDRQGKFLGQALYSPKSEIRLRLLESSRRPVDAAWWRDRLAAALAGRVAIDATAYRVVHGEADALPSLIVDRYDRWVVAQLLSAGLETMRAEIVAALVDVLAPEGVLLRNDASVRRREGLPEGGAGARHGPRRTRDPGRHGPVSRSWHGQKTGAFLDQRRTARSRGSSCANRTAPTASPTTAVRAALRAARAAAALDASRGTGPRTENAVLNGSRTSIAEGDARGARVRERAGDGSTWWS